MTKKIHKLYKHITFVKSKTTLTFQTYSKPCDIRNYDAHQLLSIFI